jgi:hypothetical protein
MTVLWHEKPNIISVKCTEMVLLCTHDKKYRVSPVGFMSIAFSFFLEQTDVLKLTPIVITDNQVAETRWY